jgi:neuroligin
MWDRTVSQSQFVDIYENAGDKSRGAGLAVLVYMNSHSDDPENPFDGSSMAVIGNLIVISVRYRTGVLGFLQPSIAENARSNFGLWDQLAALQWVKVGHEER